MAGMSNYAEETLLNWLYRRVTYTGADPYVRLYSTSHTDWEAGTGGTEEVGTGYVQYGKLAARGATNWVAPAAQTNGQRVLNKNTSAFEWSCGSDWPAINGAGLYDSNLVGGNLLWGKDLTAPKDPGSGDTFRLHNGATGLLLFDLDTTTKAGITTAAKQLMLNHLFIADQSASRPADTSYIALWTTCPDILLGTGGVEVSEAGTGYTRLAITMSTAWHAAASVGTGYHIHNSSAFSGWTAAATAWGTILGASIVNSSTGAITTTWAVDAFTGVVIDAGDTFSIAADAWKISLDESN